jgi:Family of unknown function (DUF5719)
VLALALAATGVTASLVRESNPTALPTGLSVAGNAESTALYCTGLSDVRGAFAGHVSFLNTSSHDRLLTLQTVSNTGQRASSSLAVPAHAARSVTPGSLGGTSFGLGAEVDGGGVVADVVAAKGHAEVPCSSAGTTSWYGAGFDTLVGSEAVLSVYNPTATSAVMDVTAYSSSGFSAPAPLQGFSVAAHAQVALNLGAQIVNATDVGVHVNVLRGSLVVVGEQVSEHRVSMIPGTESTTVTAWYPRVTTAGGSKSQVRVANPTSQPATVTLDVALAPYTIAPQTVTVPAYASAVAVITPNPAIPAGGYASVSVSSSEAVFTSLATGSSTGLVLSSPATPSHEVLLSDFSGRGFNSATITNTSSRTLKVTLATVAGPGPPGLTREVELGADATANVLGALTGVSSLRGVSVLVTASRPSLIVSATLPSTPRGVEVVSALDGG